MDLTRRTFLGGMALAASTPLVSALPSAVALESPKRFVFVIKASGIDGVNLVPGDPGVHPERRSEVVDEELKALPRTLSALEPFRERVTIVQGLSGNHLRGNHTAGYGTLSCFSSERAPIAPTIDALLGQRHSTGPYTLYGMATNGALLGQRSTPDDSYVQTNLSAHRAGQGVSYQASPTKAYQELFGAAAKPAEELEREQAARAGLVDFLERDAGRVRERLGDAERSRFDGYVDTFEALRRRERLKAGLADRIARAAPAYVEEKYTSTTHMDRMECQFEMAAAALEAGLTNVVCLRPDTLGAVYEGLGFGQHGLHQIGHGAGLTDGTPSHEIRRRIDAYQFGLIAKLAAHLAAVPEGDGSMLDNTLIVYTSCAGGKHHGGLTDWPFVLVGGIGDRLRGGRHVSYPSYGEPGHRAISALYLSILRAGDVDPGETFGQMDPRLRGIEPGGPLPEVLAG